MKLREARDFYRILGVICLALSILLIIRRLYIIEFNLLLLLIGLFWPIIGFIIFLKFLNRDGYPASVPEGLFYLFILYCAIYFLIDTFVILVFMGQEVATLTIIGLNVIIAIVGMVGILSYAFL